MTPLPPPSGAAVGGSPLMPFPPAPPPCWQGSPLMPFRVPPLLFVSRSPRTRFCGPHAAFPASRSWRSLRETLRAPLHTPAPTACRFLMAATSSCSKTPASTLSTWACPTGCTANGRPRRWRPGSTCFVRSRLRHARPRRRAWRAQRGRGGWCAARRCTIGSTR
eukprot:363444-Chlamydomonas_euryale.AAC.4